MPRKLPPRSEPDKRRKQIFKNIYQNLQHWHALQEDRGMEDVITVEGEDIYYGDLMVGFPYLPLRQQQAFERICLKGYTEAAARDELLPNSRSSTPVQQYADSGLVRMIAAYDAKQAGQWPPAEAPKKSKPKRRNFIMAALHPLIRTGLEATRNKIVAEIESLKEALAQVDAMLNAGTVRMPAPTKEPEPETAGPTPNPRPEGKPRLEDAAKQLVDASL